MTNQFTTEIFVKPYVARHLQNLYGDPVDLSYHRELHRMMVDGLKKGSAVGSAQESGQLTTPVRIRISEYEFYHYGWEIPPREALALNNRIENEIKLMVRMFISNYLVYGFTITKAIRNFQRLFDLPEDVFPYETIKKDFYRNGYKFDENIMDELLMKIHKTLAKNVETLVPRLGHHILKNLKDEPQKTGLS